ncbi:MAG: beta-lactamase family protein, partial [Thermomicrobiales bacterium]|nr:beta-lactamase family protein [Thermomicrobiales bacterium]
MNRDRCATGNAHPVDRPLSRRVVLRAAGVAAAPLIAGDLLHSASAAHEATPAPDALPDLSEAAPQILSGERLATFEAYVATKLAELHIPGAAVAVVQGGEVTFLQGFGVREQGQPAPINADTLLRIGSVTKSFSSLLAATLVDAGRVSWETPLVDLLPDFAVADPELTPRLTMADAFCACTGLPRRDWPVVFNSQALTPERVIDGARSLPLTAPYGEQFQYNNQMVAAGGYAAGVADGGSPDALNHAYAIALRSRVLDPIGMPRSTLDLGDVLATGDYAVPHGAEITGALQPMPLQEDDAWILPVEPTGGLWSSAREMARYVQTELQYGVSPDGRRVVSAENLARTWQPGVALAPAAPGTTPALATFGEHYALGWFTGDYFGQRLVWHNGATLGFHSLV